MPPPEVKEDFPVLHLHRGASWGSKREGHHPIISVDVHPQASAVGSIVAESCAGILGRVLGLVRSEASNKIIVQR